MSAFWLAFLSDGQVVRQSDLEELEDKDSAWLQLIKYLDLHTDITITSVQIVVNGVIYNTPSVSKRADIQNDGEPCNFWVYQKAGLIAYGQDCGQQYHYFGLSYRVADYRHYMWINTKNNEVHVEICGIDKNFREKLIEDFYKTRVLN